ncbi:unnamed protein product [Soboliphyme baturini]|uniref:TPT domain-containing protein n=1 Tax=Soboliphyme baturini TaxID=241478 RepID=A0A183IGX9_9BILA|nr:unnamed protein product [Soboliphyme baturini]
MRVSDRHVSLAVVLLCTLWYSISSTSNVLNKTILQVFPFPLTLAMSNICATALYSIPLAWTQRTNLLNVRHTVGAPWKLLFSLAFGKLIAVSSSFISLSKVPVSYAHTVKATMPLFAVVCSKIFLNERQTTLMFQVYLSLIPIVSGVVVASLSELSFNTAGLLSALGSTFAYALMNTFVKKILQETGMHHTVLLAMIAQISCLLLLPLWLINDVQSFSDMEESQRMTFRIFALLCASGFLNFAQNVCTFSLIHKLSALSYAVVNAAKRITVITVSLLTLRNPVTPVNVFGMCLAIFGVFAYNRAKQIKRSSYPFILQMDDPFFAEKMYFPFSSPILPLALNSRNLSASKYSNMNGYLHPSPSSVDLL